MLCKTKCSNCWPGGALNPENLPGNPSGIRYRFQDSAREHLFKRRERGEVRYLSFSEGRGRKGERARPQKLCRDGTFGTPVGALRSPGEENSEQPQGIAKRCCKLLSISSSADVFILENAVSPFQPPTRYAAPLRRGGLGCGVSANWRFE